jgi:hypothetical protein
MKNRRVKFILFIAIILISRYTSSQELNSNFIRAVKKGQFDKVQALLKEGVNIEAVDKNGRTALMFAVEKEYKDIVKYLLEKGAKIDIKDNKGISVIDRAHKKSGTDLLELLEMYYAMQVNSVEVYQLFFEKYPSSEYATSAKENYFYLRAENSTDPNKYQDYLEKYPDGKFSIALKDKFEEILFKDFSKTSNLETAAQYLKIYPNGKYREKIARLTEDKYYAMAISKPDNSFEAIHEYFKLYPSGRYKSKLEDYYEKLLYNKICGIDLYNPSMICESDRQQFSLLATDYELHFPNGKNINEVQDKITFVNFYSNQTVYQAKIYFQKFPNGIFYFKVISIMLNSTSDNDRSCAKIELIRFLSKREIQHDRLSSIVPKVFNMTQILPYIQNYPIREIKEANLYRKLDMLNTKYPNYLISSIESTMIFIRTFSNLGIKINTLKPVRFIILMNFMNYSENNKQDRLKSSFYGSDSVHITTSAEIDCDISIIDTQQQSVIYTQSLEGLGSFEQLVFTNSYVPRGDIACSWLVEDLMAKLVVNITKAKKLN